jgi:type IV pilus assembly protein PilN
VSTFAVYLMYDSMIAGQQRRNQMLRTQIKLLDKQIEEINNLETEKQRFISRMEVIEKLQRSRPGIVHVFDEIVKTLPDGVYLTGVQQISAGANKRLKFDGIAQSSTRVSSFMRNIDASEWLRNPELEVVQTAKGPGSQFTLTADEVSTGGQEEPGKGPALQKGKIRKASLGGGGVQQ